MFLMFFGEFVILEDFTYLFGAFVQRFAFFEIFPRLMVCHYPFFFLIK